MPRSGIPSSVRAPLGQKTHVPGLRKTGAPPGLRREYRDFTGLPARLMQVRPKAFVVDRDFSTGRWQQRLQMPVPRSGQNGIPEAIGIVDYHERGGWKGEIARARMLIAADGPRSPVARDLGMEQPPVFLAGIQAEVPGRWGNPCRDLPDASPDFFGWIIPSGKGRGPGSTLPEGERSPHGSHGSSRNRASGCCHLGGQDNSDRL